MSKTTITQQTYTDGSFTYLVIGLIFGAFAGWIAHDAYDGLRQAENSVCREENRNQPEAVIQSICGSIP